MVQVIRLFICIFGGSLIGYNHLLSKKKIGNVIWLLKMFRFLGYYDNELLVSNHLCPTSHKNIKANKHTKKVIDEGLKIRNGNRMNSISNSHTQVHASLLLTSNWLSWLRLAEWRGPCLPSDATSEAGCLTQACSRSSLFSWSLSSCFALVPMFPLALNWERY